jgi:hypothetical protein
MPIRLVAFNDLKARGIVQSWAQSKRLQLQGFPPGRMISANARRWTEEEIEDWIASRPVAGPAPRGAARRSKKGEHGTVLAEREAQ